MDLNKLSVEQLIEYVDVIKNIDADKFNLLLNNLDSLLNLIKVEDESKTITLNSNKTRVTSLRINEELYDMVRERSFKNRISISDIVNKSLLEYLNNYL